MYDKPYGTTGNTGPVLRFSGVPVLDHSPGSLEYAESLNDDKAPVSRKLDSDSFQGGLSVLFIIHY
jgi:hypothetical protein